MMITLLREGSKCLQLNVAQARGRGHGSPLSSQYLREKLRILIEQSPLDHNSFFVKPQILNLILSKENYLSGFSHTFTTPTTIVDLLTLWPAPPPMISDVICHGKCQLSVHLNIDIRCCQHIMICMVQCNLYPLFSKHYCHYAQINNIKPVTFINS